MVGEMEHVLFCPSNLANSVSAVGGYDGGGVTEWIRNPGNPIVYLSGRTGAVDITCAARGMIHLTRGLHIFSIGGDNGTLLCDLDADGAVYPVQEDVIPFCRGEAPGDAFVLTSSGSFRILRVGKNRLCESISVRQVTNDYTSIHRLEIPGGGLRLILCRKRAKGIMVEHWKLWERIEFIETLFTVHDVCVTNNPSCIALLATSDVVGMYQILIYCIHTDGKVVYEQQHNFGTFKLLQPPFRLVCVNGPRVVVWEGDNRVHVRKPNGVVVEYAGKQVRARMRKADGKIFEFRGDKVFQHLADDKSVVEYGGGDLTEETGDVIVYRRGIVPYVLGTFVGVNPSDDVLIANVLDGGLIGTVLGANGEILSHFRDIPAQRKPANRDPCYSLVDMSLVWWLGDLTVIVFNDRDMHMRWAISTIHYALLLASDINQPVAIVNRYVKTSSFVMFITEREFPTTFNARFVLLVSYDEGIVIPAEFVNQHQCQGFRLLSHDGDHIPSNITNFNDIIAWINGL